MERATIVTLKSSDTSEVTVPTTVTILAGESSATFSILCVDDSQVDGSQRVMITASAGNYQYDSKTLDVTDDENSGTGLQPLLVDDFDDNLLDGSKWRVDNSNPRGPASVTERNGRVPRH